MPLCVILIQGFGSVEIYMEDPDPLEMDPTENGTTTLLTIGFRN